LELSNRKQYLGCQKKIKDTNRLPLITDAKPQK
jgi:hypothetical protein